MTSSTSSERTLVAGVVGRPHGLDGSFYVLRPVVSLLEVGTPVCAGARSYVIARRAGTDGRPLVRLEGCDDRDAAEALRGVELCVARADAPELEQDEWWPEDLKGCAVLGGRRLVGTVRRVLALPSCEVLEVQREDGGELLVPFVRDAVLRVDLGERQIEVDLRFLAEA